jgi:hypothetical protein
MATQNVASPVKRAPGLTDSSGRPTARVVALHGESAHADGTDGDSGPRRDDRLSPARGILIGLAVVLVFWGAVVGAVVLFRHS